MSDETIPLRLTRADADLIRRLQRDGICSDVEGLIERLDAALAADPAPDDLETAIRRLESTAWTFVDMSAPGMRSGQPTSGSLNSTYFNRLVDALKNVERIRASMDRKG